MNLYKGLLFQGGYFTTPEQLKALGPVEESIGLAGGAQKRGSRPEAASAIVGGECCLPA